MKTRILSLVLAVIMVVSLAAVFSVTSSADEMGITVTVGKVYAAPGTEAFVDFYISAKALPETHHHLRNWQFDLDTDLEVVEKSTYSVEEAAASLYVSGGTANWFANKATKNIGNSSDTGADVGTATQLQYRGGWKVASLKFEVPADAEAGAEYTIDVATVVNLVFEGEDSSKESQVDEKENANLTIVPGKVVVVESVEGTLEEDETEGAYVIPSFSEDGKTLITSALNADGDPALLGAYTTLTVPAFITDLGDALDECAVESIILKSTALGSDEAKAVAGLGSKTDPVDVYIHKRANGAGTTAEAFDGLSNTNKQKVVVHNLLEVYAERKTVTISGVEREAIVFGITADDVDYDSLTVVVTAGGKTKEIEVTGVYKTVRGIATTKESVAETNPDYFYLEDYTYIASVAIKGLPENATVTLYGVTADYNGNPIVVCSDTVTV